VSVFNIPKQPIPLTLVQSNQGRSTQESRAPTPPPPAPRPPAHTHDGEKPSDPGWAGAGGITGGSPGGTPGDPGVVGTMPSAADGSTGGSLSGHHMTADAIAMTSTSPPSAIVLGDSENFPPPPPDDFAPPAARLPPFEELDLSDIDDRSVRVAMGSGNLH